jgi:hypothetical protein
MDACDDERVLLIYLACNAMDPGGKSSFADLRSELAPEEAERFSERVQGRGPERLRPADPEAGRAALLAIVEQATTRLEVLLGVHREREAVTRPGRLDGLAFEEGAEGERLRRYQLGIDRALHRTINQFFKVRKEAQDQDFGDVRDDEEASVPVGDRPIEVSDETKPIRAADPLDAVAEEPDLEPISVGQAVQPDGVPQSQAGQPDLRSGPVKTSADRDRLIEAAAKEPPPSAVAEDPDRPESGAAGRRAASRPIPPMIIQALQEFVRQQTSDVGSTTLGTEILASGLDLRSADEGLPPVQARALTP